MAQPQSVSPRRKESAAGARRPKAEPAAGSTTGVLSETTRRITESVDRLYELNPEATNRVLAAALMLRARDLLLHQLDSVLGDYGTSHARYQVLSIVCNVPEGLQLSEIAIRASVHSTTMTATIDRLVRDGLLVRKPSPHDRRTILAVSTPKGRQLYAKAHAELISIEYGLVQVDSETIRNVLEGLDKIAAVLEATSAANK